MSVFEITDFTLTLEKKEIDWFIIEMFRMGKVWAPLEETFETKYIVLFYLLR